MNPPKTIKKGSISCLDSVYFVSLKRDEELSNAGEILLEQHLEACKSCQQASQQFESMHHAIDALLGRSLMRHA